MLMVGAPQEGRMTLASSDAGMSPRATTTVEVAMCLDHVGYLPIAQIGRP
jgi:hypothetical protein